MYLTLKEIFWECKKMAASILAMVNGGTALLLIVLGYYYGI